MNTPNSLLYSAQNPTEVYLQKMNPNSELKLSPSVVSSDVLENTYVEYDHMQLNNFSPLSSRQNDGIELNYALGGQNDLVNMLQVKLDKNLHTPTNTLIHTVFINPYEMCTEKPTDSSGERETTSKTQNNQNLVSTNDSSVRKCDYIHISDRVVPQRALAVLPTALRIKRGIVTPRRLLPPRVRFGPIQGIRHSVSSLVSNELILNGAANKTPVFLLKVYDNNITHIDVTDKDKSNWMCLLPLGNENTANVWIYEENDELYGITTESIPPRKPLMLGYSKSYVRDHALPKGQPVLDLTEASSVQKEWWCFVCRKPMASDILMQQHIDFHHKDDMAGSRRRYHHCRHCKRKFCRLYTLKRHLMSRFCLKNATQSQDKKYPVEPPDVGINITQSTEDNRMPSDESFQNYSNSLDFSTNLFEDRMPGLDISGNSRGETDFIPYTIDREENLVAALGFTNGLDCKQPLENKTTDKSEREVYFEVPVVSSLTINQDMPKKKRKRQSIQLRQFECQCGRMYSTKEKLAKHVYTVCSVSQTPKPNADNSSQSEAKYKCEECQLNFKRRGMLVNHLWRVHNAPSTSVPLEKRIRHYPCVVCPKIYSSAAKRNHHVNIHHPGAQGSRARWLEGGLVACAPAACAACPRQYCTRAKLLQHVRHKHPHLAHCH